MRIALAVACLVAFGSACASAQRLPDWEAARRSSESAIDHAIVRLEAENTELGRKYAGILRELKANTRASAEDVRVRAARKSAFFATHQVPGRSREELQEETQAVLEGGLLAIYGWLEPEAFNEAWSGTLEENPGIPLSMPEYPLALLTTDARYCARYGARSANLEAIIRSIDPEFLPAATPSICEGPLDGRLHDSAAR